MNILASLIYDRTIQWRELGEYAREVGHIEILQHYVDILEAFREALLNEVVRITAEKDKGMLGGELIKVAWTIGFIEGQLDQCRRETRRVGSSAEEEGKREEGMGVDDPWWSDDEESD